MADVNVKAVLSVYAQTNDAVREIGKARDAIKQLGEQSEKSGGGISGFIAKAVDGFGKFNLAVGGVQKAFGLLNGAIDTAINESRLQNMEKVLPFGTVDRFRDATDKLISRNEVLRLSLKGLTGDFKITDGQMETVLKTSIALSQKTGEHADVIADKLLDALAKGVNKLDDYGISLEKSGDRQYDVNQAMIKFGEIIAENPVDEQTKSLMQLKDTLLEIAQAVATVVAAAVSGLKAIADWAEWGEYSGDFWNMLSGGTNYELRGAQQKMRDAKAKQAGGEFYADLMGSTDSMQSRLDIEREYRDKLGGGGYSDADYAYAITRAGMGEPQFAPGKAVEKKKGATPVYVVNAREVGEHVVYGRDNVRSLSAVASDVAVNRDLTSRFRGPQSPLLNTAGDFGPNGTFSGYSRTSGYDPSNPLGSMSASIGQAGMNGGVFSGAGALAGQGAFDAGAAGMLAGIEAIISGQDAVGKSIARASSQALKAKAVEWGAFAIGELAWGIADAARLLPTAAGHFAAAAKFGAAAAAAGLGAGALGQLAGGGGGGGGGSAGGGYAPTGASREVSGGGQTIVVNIGDGFVGSPAELAEKVGMAVRDNNRRGGRDSYPARFSG